MSSRRSWLIILGGMAAITLAVGWGVNRYLIDQRVEFASERLLLLSNLRREALERYFETAEAELRFWSTTEELVSRQLWLNAAWDQVVDAGADPKARLRQHYLEQRPVAQATDIAVEGQYRKDTYFDFHDQFHPLAAQFVHDRGYYDVFLISPAGNIHYSVAKEDDFATNLFTGKYKDTGLAEAFRRALEYGESDDVAISDMESYAPSGGQPAMFMAKAMYGPDGKLAGAFAMQLPTRKIVDIMNFDAGMLNTGETYLVGDDLLMRSNSRFIQESTILSETVDTVTANKALKGEYGVQFTDDYRGEEVLSAYSSTVIDDHTWAVMAEIDKAEILELATSDNPTLAGLMLFFYSLGVWTVWYIQRSDADAEGIAMLGDLDLDSGLDLGDS